MLFIKHSLQIISVLAWGWACFAFGAIAGSNQLTGNDIYAYAVFSGAMLILFSLAALIPTKRTTLEFSSAVRQHEQISH